MGGAVMERYHNANGACFMRLVNGSNGLELVSDNIGAAHKRANVRQGTEHVNARVTVADDFRSVIASNGMRITFARSTGAGAGAKGGAK